MDANIKSDIDGYINNIFKNTYKLDIGNRKGNKGYIDFIKPEELTDSVMSGVDCYQRKFVVIKATFIFNDGSKRESFQTYFERYRNSHYVWAIGSHYGESLFCNSVGRLNPEHIEFLNELITNREVLLNKQKIQKLNLFFNKKQHESLLSTWELLNDDDYPTNLYFS